MWFYLVPRGGTCSSRLPCFWGGVPTRNGTKNQPQNGTRFSSTSGPFWCKKGSQNELKCVKKLIEIWKRCHASEHHYFLPNLISFRGARPWNYTGRRSRIARFTLFVKRFVLDENVIRKAQFWEPSWLQK